MAQKTTTYAQLRDVIIIAHNNGNRKAISKDMVQGAGVHIEYFNAWVKDVNALRCTCKDYVLKKNAFITKKQYNGLDVSEADVAAARERIYPKWKEVLHVGDSDPNTKELHVSELDIEDLIKFSWDYMADPNKGTIEHVHTEQIFRKYVESLLGCRIAKNEMLDDTDRDDLTAYQSAQRRIQNCTETIGELEKSKKNYELDLKGLPEAEAWGKKFLENKITELEAQIRAEKEKKATAEADAKKYNAKAQAILNRISTIKVK